MKPPLPSALLLLACLAPTPGASIPVVNVKTPYCISQTNQTTNCGVSGTFPSPDRYYKAFTVHECAQRCFGTNFSDGTCKSFGFHPAKRRYHTAGLCKILFTEFYASPGFRPNPDVKSTFWARSCFALGDTNTATPLLDGSFSDASSSAPWTGFGPSYATHYDYDGDGDAYVGAFTASLHTYSRNNIDDSQAYISQTFPTCYGDTYKLTYQIGYRLYDNGESPILHDTGPGFFYIEGNFLELYDRYNSDDAALAQARVVYFVARAGETLLRFGYVPNDAYTARDTVYIDNVVVQSVYRATVPKHAAVQVTGFSDS